MKPVTPARLRRSWRARDDRRTETAWATTEEQANALAAWARGQGLRYERYGQLPTASALLDASESPAEHTARVARHLPVPVPTTQDRRDRWDENLCTGVLPGRVEGTLAHHAYWYFVGGETGGWRIGCRTVVLARVLEGIGVARDLESRTNWPTEFLFEREYGPEYKYVEHDRLTWRVPVEEDEGLVRLAVEGVPPTAHYSLREGIVVVSVEDARDDPEDLYQLSLATAAFADGLRRAKRTQRPLLPGDALPAPRPTPYREWTEAGADRVAWRDPPPDLGSAVTGYAAAAGADPNVRRRSTRGRRIVLGLFALVALFAGAIGYAAGSPIGAGAPVGIAGAAIFIGIGAFLALKAGGGAGGTEAAFRRQAWGLTAFAREYARLRGMRFEDPDEFRRRFPMPVPGSPQRVMRGELSGGVDGRVVLWRDRNLKEGRGYVNMAIVAAPAAVAHPPFVATPAEHGWLVVAEWVEEPGRSVARLDAVRAEAARLAQTADLA